MVYSLKTKKTPTTAVSAVGDVDGDDVIAVAMDTVSKVDLPPVELQGLCFGAGPSADQVRIRITCEG